MEGKIWKNRWSTEAVDCNFDLLDLSVTDMFYKLHSIMSPLVNMYVPLRQEKNLISSMKPSSNLKRQKYSMAQL